MKEKKEMEDNELTIMCMVLSEQSLNECWVNEDDEYWQSFLK